MNLESLVKIVSGFIRDNPDERDCWQKGPALTGLLRWDDEEFRPMVRRWINRAVDTQKSDGNLSYGDWHTSSGGHIRTFTPLASETSAVGAPMMDLYARTKEERYLESAAKQYQAVLDAPKTSEGGVWSRGEAPELWIDFTYLMCPFIGKYGVHAGKADAVDESFKQFRVHVKRLLDDEFKLARHAWCEKPNHFPQSTFWARGNGWLLACCVEMLDIDPEHKEADYVREVFADVLNAMSHYQDASGYFYHVLDEPLSNLEASSTLMYAYSAAESLRLGITTKDFSQDEIMDKALRAFKVVAGAVEPSGKVPGVAKVPGGPGVAFDWTLFGQGFFLLAAHVLQDKLTDFEVQ